MAIGTEKVIDFDQTPVHGMGSFDPGDPPLESLVTERSELAQEQSRIQSARAKLEARKLLADTRKSELELKRLRFAARQELSSAALRGEKETAELRKITADAKKSEA